MSQSFPPTSWTLLRMACEDDTRGHEALKEFSGQYYEPVLAFFEILFKSSSEDPEDHTHTFFLSKILSRRLLQAADRREGSFRHFLKQSLRNYCYDVFRKLKLTDGRTDSLDDEDRGPVVPEDDPWPRVEAAFHEAWVRTLLQRALDVVAERCVRSGQEIHLDLFLSRYAGPEDFVESWAELGRRYDLDQKKARSRAETVARQLREIVIDLLVEDTGSEEAAEDELATLRALLGEAQ